MPAQVLAVELGVVDRDVVHLPERILGGDPGVVNLHVAHVLEDILAVALEPVDADVPAEHEGIGAAVQDKVPDPDSVAAPEHLVGIVHRHVSISISLISRNIFGASITVSVIFRWSEYHSADRPPTSK